MRTPYEQKLLNKQEEKTRFEEENFVRLPETKKERQLRKRLEREAAREDVGDLS